MAADADTIEAAMIDLTGCEPVDAGGRGVVYRFRRAAGEGIVRIYRRGGAIRHVLRETYFFDNRPRKEFNTHPYAQQQGLSVPPLLGVAWKQIGPAIRGCIATGYIDAVHLQRWLETNTVPDAPRLRNVGKLIRHMHELGISHADLQVQNILMARDQIYLIDFDRAAKWTLLKERTRRANLLRLRRSFIKNGLPLSAFQYICQGYDAEHHPGSMERVSDNGPQESRT